jgi:uncharacterized protein (DUF697 family)
MSEQAVAGDRHAAAGKIIASATKWSAAAALIPVPLLDLAALATVQSRMVVDLAVLYGESANKEVARGLVSVLLGTIAPASLAGAVAGSGIKAMPGVGTALGAASMAAFSGAATYAIGKVFVRHFEKGGSLMGFSAEAVTEDLKAEFAKGSAAA